MINRRTTTPARSHRAPVTCTRPGRPGRPWRGVLAAGAVLLAAGVAVWSGRREPWTDARKALSGPSADEAPRADAWRTPASVSSAVTAPWLATARRLPPPDRVHGRQAPVQTVLDTPPGVARGVVPAPTTTPQDPERGAEELPVFAALRASRGQPIPPEVAELAQQITQGATNETMRARALYTWITEHIRYDVQEWAHITGGGSAYMNAHDPLSVIERGTTVCAGYAWLYDAMARSVGLDSTFLIGAVRGYRGTPDDALVSAFKHAWNAVRVDGAWRLLDATWGARQTGEPATDHQARQAYYFDTPPGQMIFDHLPESPDWQLLDEPLPDAKAFHTLPNLKPAFFQHGLRLGNAFAATVTAEAAAGGRLVVTAPGHVQVAATLSPRGGRAEPRTLPVSVAGERRDIQVDPLEPGEYILRVYSRLPEEPRFTCSADFVLRAAP